MGVKRWRTRALDRTKWVSVLSEAKAKLKGLLCETRRRRRNVYHENYV
jgi:hypothetical protein